MEIQNVGNIIAKLDDDEKRDDIQIMDAIGRKQNVWWINESGLYSLILSSRKPQAKRFKKWVTSVVIPSIRKTGQYTVSSQQTADSQALEKHPSVASVREVFAGLTSVGISPSLVESATLSAIAKTIPHLALAAEEGKRLISSQMVVPEIPMSPTDIGKAIAQQLQLSKVPSPQQVNQALMNAGLQVAEVTVNKQGKRKTEWHLTELGNNYGQMQMDTAKGHNKTIFHPRWFLRVINVIQEDFIRDRFE